MLDLLFIKKDCKNNDLLNLIYIFVSCFPNCSKLKNRNHEKETVY